MPRRSLVYQTPLSGAIASGITSDMVAAGANSRAVLVNGAAFTAPVAGNYLVTLSNLLMEEYGATGATTYTATLQAGVDGAPTWVNQGQNPSVQSVGGGSDISMLAGSWMFTLTAGAHLLYLAFYVGNAPVAVRNKGHGLWLVMALI